MAVTTREQLHRLKRGATTGAGDSDVNEVVRAITEVVQRLLDPGAGNGPAGRQYLAVVNI